MVTSLVRCRSCKLLYRIPTDDEDEQFAYYDHTYSSGLTTDCPSEVELKRYLETGFRRTGKDFSEKIALMRTLGVEPGSKVLDYGASWGYFVWQLRSAGYDAIGYDVSRYRVQYAQDRLRVPITDNPGRLLAHERSFDAFLAVHVLEHITPPQQPLEMARQLLRPGGLLGPVPK